MRPVRRREEIERETERQAEYDAVIAPDPLLAEVGRTNERIRSPDEAGRVVLSKPCEEEASDSGGRRDMTTAQQRNAARRNVQKATAAAKPK